MNLQSRLSGDDKKVPALAEMPNHEAAAGSRHIAVRMTMLKY
jgi:hypothetical protein